MTEVLEAGQKLAQATACGRGGAGGFACHRVLEFFGGGTDFSLCFKSAAACFLLAATAHAGVVQGTVQEFASGYALSRTVVRLIPVPRADNIDLKQMQLRTAGAGQFVFFSVPDGYYFLVATREGYFPGAYGQRRPDGQGTPIFVTKDSDLFAQLRMRRKGALTGRVLDENGVGIEGVPVVAYRSRLPLRVAGQGISDDRGVYRIHGLDAGKYWVRATAHTLDDGSGILPTFGPQSREVREARAHDVRLDEDTPDADVRPEFGNLFQLGGEAQCFDGIVKVTLTSETVHRVTQVPCGAIYTFPSLSPAVYEITAENLKDKESGYTELFVDKATSNASVKLQPPPTVDFDIRRAGSASPVNFPVTVTGRRQDLYDAETEQQIPTPHATLLAGHWEMSAQAGEDKYVESISTNRGEVRREGQPEKSVEWFDIFIEARYNSRIRITVADKAAQITGSVTKEGKGVPGAPVFLWPTSEAGRRSLKGYRMVIADTEGKYHFEGLPPGDYRMLATYDFTEIDEASLDEGLAITIHAEASQKTSADLSLWISP
jgi:protocatechuate 3,4-dioxygenase beta subunit